MTTLREAAQQALEALEYGQHTLKQISENEWESRGVLAMNALRAALLARARDYEDDYKAVVNEQCAGDEVHCSCVPHLRKRIKEVEAERDALRADASRFVFYVESSPARRDAIHALLRSAPSIGLCAVDAWRAAIDAAKGEQEQPK